MSLPSNWIQSDGKWYAPVREFTCPDHPYGPPSRDVSEAVVDCVRFAVGEDLPFAEAARVELGLCCESHRWIETGEMREVSALELFMYSNMLPLVQLHRTDLLKAMAADNLLPGKTVRIPIIRGGTRAADRLEELEFTRLAEKPILCAHCGTTCAECEASCERCNE